jgi:uncharacterized protein
VRAYSPFLRHFIRVFALLVALAGAANSSVPELTGRVVDAAGVLSSGTVAGLTEMLARHEAETGNQVVVLTVPSLGGEDIESYADRVFRAWALGQRGTDNGVLVLVAPADRQMRIEVGYGLEGELTDSRAARLIRNVFTPHFRNGDYDAGILSGVSALVNTIEGTYEPEESGEDDLGFFGRLMFGLLFVAMPWGMALPGQLTEGAGRHVLTAFLSIFVYTGALVVFNLPLMAGAVWLLFIGSIAILNFRMARSPYWRDVREQVKAASASGKSTPVRVGGMTFNVGGSSSGGSGRSGGFSGGGGRSGGGGASGRW